MQDTQPVKMTAPFTARDVEKGGQNTKKQLERRNRPVEVKTAEKMMSHYV